MKRYNYRHTEAYKERKAQSQYRAPRQHSTVNIDVKKQTIFPLKELKNRKGLIKRSCPTCEKEFATYRCFSKVSHKSYCSRECYKNRTMERKYAMKMIRDREGVLPIAKAHAILTKKGVYKGKIESYKDKLIPYEESPTGRAYIGIHKRPLMPVKNGHGFYGVILQDEKREFIQCNGCGKWMQKITATHIEKCTNLTTEKYKEKYGLNLRSGLVSDETSFRLTQAALKNKVAMAVFKTQHNKGYRKGKYGRKGKHTMQFFNKYGTCPLQLRTRLYEFINCNRYLPGPGNRGQSIYKAIVKRFGTFGEGLKQYGLPYLERKGTNMKYEFPDGTVYAYNINQFYDRERLYSMMKEKCPVLSQSQA